MKTIGGTEVSAAVPQRPAADPPMISSAAPPAGSKASTPGKAIEPFSTKAAAITRTSPAQPSRPTRLRRAANRAGSRATRPPRPSSQILVVVTK